MSLWPKIWIPGSPEERVRSFAIESGFDAVGYARAGPVDSIVADHYRKWLKKNHHAGMSYMEKRVEERLDPRRVLPEANTVIAVLGNYYRENPSEKNGLGKVARYAGGRDYHRVVGGQLKTFKKKIEEAFPDSCNRYEVDTGPVLERYWAEQAGVGFVGKNTLLINTRLGSWVFIGILLTSLKLESSEPHKDHCGTCTRCLESCPTGAFPEPGVLDARKCISYWTIEHRGELPQEVAEHLNGWLFGCDDCQTVCPWNRHARPSPQHDYEAREPFRSPDARQIAGMTYVEWDEATRGTAIRRATYQGLLRNARALLRQRENETRE